MTDSMTTAEKWGQAFGKAAYHIGKAVVFIYLVNLLVFKGSWDLLVPTLFPGAVEQGLVAGSISWWTAFCLGGAVTLVGAFVRWGTASWRGSSKTEIALMDGKLNAIATHLGIDLESAPRTPAEEKTGPVGLHRSHTDHRLTDEQRVS